MLGQGGGMKPDECTARELSRRSATGSSVLCTFCTDGSFTEFRRGGRVMSAPLSPSTIPFNPFAVVSNTNIEHLARMRLDQPKKKRMTSIIATIGPKTNTPEMLAELRKCGVNIIRLNFSHGSHEYHGGIIDNVKKSFDVLPGRPVAIALDTKGPEIRTGNMVRRRQDGPLFVAHGWLTGCVFCVHRRAARFPLPRARLSS